MTIEPSKASPLRHELKHQINLREDLVLSQKGLENCFHAISMQGQMAHTG